MKKIVSILFVIVAALMFATSAHALPWLDIGAPLLWNSNTNTLTNYYSSTQVYSASYLDGTSVAPPISDPVLGSNVELFITFDTVDDDFIRVYNSGGDWLYAKLDFIGPAVSNPFAGFNMGLEQGLQIDTSRGSRWASEFYSQTVNLTNIYPGLLNIYPTYDKNEITPGVWKINAPSKIVPTPEPGTILLLGAGLAGVGFYTRRRKI